MIEKKFLAEQFEANRSHLRSVAYRILGSRSEAEDAVQEAWFRLARSDANEVDNLRGWLTTVVARLCLDLLRSRKARNEQALDTHVAETVAAHDDAERDLQLADSMGVALLMVLETLAPAERVAFVLHDVFNLPFEEIAAVVNRTPAAARQLASRARRRVQVADEPDTDRIRQRELVSAFLTAAREGDFAALLGVLDPEVVLHADAAAIQMSIARQTAGAPTLHAETRGAAAVAKIFEGRARAAQLAMVDGAAGVVFAPGGLPRVVFNFVVENDRIVEISLMAEPQTISGVQLSIER